MATYTTTVDPNGGADYASINAWVGGEDTLYSSGDIAIADCLRAGATKDTTAVGVTGFTAGVIPKIIVNSAYRHEGKWADQRSDSNYIYHLSVSANSIPLYLNNAGTGTTVDGLCLSFAADSSLEYKALFNISAAANFVISNNILRNLSTRGTRRGLLLSSYSDNNKIYNNIVIGPFSDYGISLINTDSYVYNNTVYDSVYGIITSGGSPVVKNNYCGANSSGDFSLAAGSGDYNVSSDASAVGTNKATGKNSYTDYFVAPANGDFHLKDSSYNLWGINSENLTATFTTDIDGDTRPNSDQFGIGADEYVASGGGSAVDATSGALAIAGLDASVSQGTTVSASLGTASVAGLNAQVSQGATVTATSGAVSVSGLSASVSQGATISASAGAVSIAGLNVQVSAGTTMGATVGDLSIAGYAATVSNGLTIGCTLGTVAVFGLNASVSQGTTIAVSAGALTVAGYNATLSIGTTIETTAGAITVVPFPAVVSDGLGVIVECFVGSILVSGLDFALYQTPPSRTNTINVEDRTNTINVEDRTNTINVEDRTNTIT